METLLELPWWFLIPLVLSTVMFWVSLWFVVAGGGALLINRVVGPHSISAGAWVICCGVFVTFLLFGCGEQSEYAVASNAKYQIHGVVVYADTEAYPSRYVMQEATDLYIEEAAERFGYSEAALVKVFKGVGSIVFHDHKMPYQDRLVGGTYDLKSSDILLGYVPPCIRQSSYFHELNHHFLRALKHGIDAEHWEETWWRDLLIDVRRALVNSPVRETC